MRFLLFLLCVIFSSSFVVGSKRFITASLQGQTGNLCFQIATASALAWDHGAEAFFPDLEKYPEDAKHLFFRCAKKPPSSKISKTILEQYPLPFYNKSQLHGYFQSETYFAHHRKRILQLFSLLDADKAYIEENYTHLLSHPLTVGVQIRYYRREIVEGYPQYGIRFLEKAMAHFPEDTLFIVSSDDLVFAKKQIPVWVKNVHFLENNPPHIDLFILSLCKHNIISNSTFGWWAAWLNQNPEKMVLCPAYWTKAATTYPLPVCPKEWIQFDVPAEDL